jgi:hypothetical protein
MDERQYIDDALEAIHLSENVPPEVTTRFDDVRNILRCAREHHRLLRPAIEYTTVTVELALRILCGRLGFTGAMGEEETQSLINFIEWLAKRDYLPYWRAEEPEDRPGREVENDSFPEFYKALRRLRNSWLHTKDDNWLGWEFAKHIPSSARFVSNLYQNPTDRQDARKERRRVNKHVRRLSRDGCAIVVEDARTLVHEVNVLHCDVGMNPNEYYIAFWPLFDLHPNRGDILSDLNPRLALATVWTKLENGSVAFAIKDGRTLTIERELPERESNELKSWKKEAGRSRHRAFDLYGPAQLRACLLNLRRPSVLALKDLQWINSEASYPSDRAIGLRSR